MFNKSCVFTFKKLERPKTAQLKTVLYLAGTPGMPLIANARAAQGSRACLQTETYLPSFVFLHCVPS